MYHYFPQFILRTPFLSYDKLSYILDNLQQELSTPIFQEAIYLASPILYDELQKYLRGQIKDKNEEERIRNSLVRYLSRMSTRCTPFGLFAGCSIGEIGGETNIQLEEVISRTTRLDMYYLCTLYDVLVRKEYIKDRIKYFSNSSLYTIGKKIRYVETLYSNTRRKYQIAEVEHTFYLNFIIKKSYEGIFIQDIAKLLVNEYITIDDATNYLHKLIDSQILVGELSNSVTGNDFLSRIIEMLERINYSGNELPLLIRVNKLLKELDKNRKQYNKNNTIYQEIVKLIKDIGIPFEEKYLFQTDMVRETSSAVLGESIIQELQKTMGFLNKITPSNKNEKIGKFQEDFYNRYEEREIPLMEALDPEIGIGYMSNNNGDISPLVDDFAVPLRRIPDSFHSTTFASLLMRKTIDCLSKQKKEIILNDDDIKDLETNGSDLPPTIYTMCEVLNANPEEILIKTSYFGGSCAANLLGRFAHTDKKINILIKAITRLEQELMDEMILAEIVHLPEARIGNIQSRPHIRKYELLYLADSDLPRQELIHISDLVLSIKQGRLVIKSKKLNKEIIPRLTTAHNYRNNTMPVYQFLCDMQHPYGRAGLYFSWGQLENNLDFRPRVRYSNTILSPASWTVRIEDMKYLFEIEDDIYLINEVTKWRETFSLPQKTLMPDGDNELYIDWENTLSIKSLFSVIKRRQIVKFEEFLFDTEKSPVTYGPRKCLNECIIAFHK